jgi:hypothetical protein
METLRFSFHSTFTEAGRNNGCCSWLLYDPINWKREAQVWVKIQNYENVEWLILSELMVKMRHRFAEIMYTN